LSIFRNLLESFAIQALPPAASGSPCHVQYGPWAILVHERDTWIVCDLIIQRLGMKGYGCTDLFNQPVRKPLWDTIEINPHSFAFSFHVEPNTLLKELEISDGEGIEYRADPVSDPWINHDLFTIFHTINSVHTAQGRIFYG
jgi:hypothetical protein